MTLLLLASPAGAQSDPFLELGIPVSSPLKDPAKAPGASAPRAAAAPHPLEGRLAAHAATDLEDVRGWGKELDAVLAYAAGRPQVFPPAPVERGALFDEYRAEAAAAWARALDLLLALDSAAALYAEAPRLADKKARARASAVLAETYETRARFTRAWARYAERDPALAALFDEEAPGSGVGPGAFSRLRARFAAGRVRGEAGLARAARPVFALRSSALRAEAGEVPDRQRLPLMLPPLEGDVSVSSRVGYAVGTFRRWFRLDASTAPALPGRAELAAFADGLEPGDILLARRSGALGSVGSGGWWDGAGVYLGTDAQRRAASGDDSLSAALRAAAPEAAAASTAAARVDLPAVACAGRGGVRVESLARFAASDAAAALRPRLDARARAAAVERAARLAGRPLSEGEFLAAAYAGALALEPEEAAGRRAAGPNALARRFDARFGTPEQDLDFVGGIAPGGEAEERRMTLEAFRASWRRPRWELEPDKESTP